jgi:GTP-binding protein YchF
MDFRGRPVDSKDQMESVLLELVVSDLEKVEKRLERIGQDRKRGLKVSEIEASTLEKCKAHLETEKALRSLELSAEEEKILRTFQFLSLKPIMAIANLDESRLDGSGLQGLTESAATHKIDVMQFAATLEAEMALLDAEAQAEFLKDYGLNEPGRVRLIQAAYRLLNLISFFTVGEDEVRAWTIRRGTTALNAAGKIHSDIERGFIRAETVACDDLLKTQSWSACRDNATLRLEGKTYEVKDGDVINFRHNA